MLDSQKEHVLERLRHLLQTRFAGGKESEPAAAATSPPASQKTKLPSVSASQYAAQLFWNAGHPK